MLSSQYPRGARPGDHLGELLVQVATARELGFDSVWALHHYLANLETLQPFPLLGRVAAEAGDMRLGTNIFILPLHHPVEAAELYATLDHLAPGGVVAGVGLGYRDHEFEAFDIAMGERVGRLVEGVAVMRELWSGEPVHHAGRHFRVDGARIGITPRRPGGPPVWVGSGVEVGVRRAARLGDAVLLLHTERPSRIGRLLDAFRDERARHGAVPATAYPVFRELCLRSDAAAAAAVARPHLRTEAEAYAAYGVSFLTERFDDLCTGAYILSDPADCVERLRTLEALGVTDVIVRVQWCGMPHEEAMETLRVFGDAVLPALSDSRPAPRTGAEVPG